MDRNLSAGKSGYEIAPAYEELFALGQGRWPYGIDDHRPGRSLFKTTKVSVLPMSATRQALPETTLVWLRSGGITTMMGTGYLREQRLQGADKLYENQKMAPSRIFT